MPSLEALVDLIERDPNHNQLADPRQAERLLFDQLAAHEDPTWREIGQQLRDGQMNLRRLADVDAYWDHLQRGLARRDTFRDALAATKAELETAQAKRRERDGRSS